MDPESLARHRQSHSERRRHLCPVCPCFFLEADELAMHVTRAHPKMASVPRAAGWGRLVGWAAAHRRGLAGGLLVCLLAAAQAAFSLGHTELSSEERTLRARTVAALEALFPGRPLQVSLLSGGRPQVVVNLSLRPDETATAGRALDAVMRQGADYTLLPGSGWMRSDQGGWAWLLASLAGAFACAELLRRGGPRSRIGALSSPAVRHRDSVPPRDWSGWLGGLLGVLALTQGALAALCGGALMLLLAWRRREQRISSRIIHGRQEAAILLMSLPPQSSASVFKELGLETVQQLTIVISKLPPVPPELRDDIVQRFSLRARVPRLTSEFWEKPSKRREQMLKRVLSTLQGEYLSSSEQGALFSASPVSGEVPRWSSRPLLPEWGRAGLGRAGLGLRGLRLGGLGLGGLGLGGLLAVVTWVALAQTSDPVAQLNRQVRALSPQVRGVEALGDRLLVLTGPASPAYLQAVERLTAAEAARLQIGAQVTALAGAPREWPCLHPAWLLGLLPGLAWLKRRRAKGAQLASESPGNKTEVGPGLGAETPPLESKGRGGEIAETAAPSAVRPAKADTHLDLLVLEFGPGLRGIVDPLLQTRIKMIRRHLWNELGLPFPPVRLSQTAALQPNEWSLNLRRREVARGTLMCNQFLAVGPELKLHNLRGMKTLDPTFGMPGMWISPEQRGDAERLGCMIFDPCSVVATAITEAARKHARELFSFDSYIHLARRPQLRSLTRQLHRQLPAVEVWNALGALLGDGLPLSDWTTLLETLLLTTRLTTDSEVVHEALRGASMPLWWERMAARHPRMECWPVPAYLEADLQGRLTADQAAELGRRTASLERSWRHEGIETRLALTTLENRRALGQLLTPMDGWMVLSQAELPAQRPEQLVFVEEPRGTIPDTKERH